MICLGIEGTAHTIAASVVDSKNQILSDIRAMYTTEKTGIIPKDAAKFMEEKKNLIIENSLEEANLTFDDVDVIAFSQGPGLAPSLLVTLNLAKSLALKYKKPLVGINHIAAHLNSGFLFCNIKDPVYVFVSGANTQIIVLESKKYRILGETLSIGLGNALDKFGRIASLGFPAGSKIEELAKKGSYIKLPYSVKGMDVDFSGIVTEAIRKLNQGERLENLCFSLQETCFSMLTEVTERALAHTEKKEIIVIGGVAANKRFSEMLSTMCKERSAKFYICPIKYAGDQATMIAYLGLKIFKTKKLTPLEKIDILPRWRADEIDVNWKN
ncbi:tRNA (adenosine(37)-N6)-threonylcarbamoyltransferase complex transferase subunit TsaD [Candidatus Woesearchaeota archaeon]|nr:tRNA (adenosine(37)-N6)-threonylcarbamoyltransferase complex transferase subunit TsaD [Candidatus Woesearchaeota archaeon]